MGKKGCERRKVGAEDAVGCSWVLLVVNGCLGYRALALCFENRCWVMLLQSRAAGAC